MIVHRIVNELIRCAAGAWKEGYDCWSGAAIPLAAMKTLQNPKFAKMYQIQRTHDLDGLLRDPELWNRLAGGVPFRETSWLGPWWNHFGKVLDLEPYVLVARDAKAEICGILPLYLRHSKSQGRTLSMIGDGQACSDYVSLLASADDGEAVATAMAEFLADAADDSDHGWDFIDIDGVVEDDAVMIAFAKALSQRDALLHTQSRMCTWFKPRDANWNEHLKHFKKTQRRKMRRWSERVEATEELALTVSETSDNVHRDLDQLIEMHQRRWNEAGEPGTYADPRFCRFIHDATADFFRRGRLHLASLSFDEQRIAADLNFVGGDRRMYCFSGGYDLDFANMEPGRILTVEAIKHMYREDLAGIDYLRGDEPYKKRMAATAKRILNVRVAAPTWWPRLRHAAWWTGFEVKQWMRRRTGRTPIVVVDLAAGTLAPQSI